MPRLRQGHARRLQAVAIGCCAFFHLTQAANAALATVDGRILEAATSSDAESERCMVRVDASLPAAGLDCEGDWVAFDCPAEGAAALVGDRLLASSRLALATGKRVELLVADGSADGVCRAERIKVQDEADEEADEDGDGVLNLADDLPLDPSSAVDLDGDGEGDEVDVDDDGDGIPDVDDPAPRLRNRAPTAVGSLPDRTVFHEGGRSACLGTRVLRLTHLQALFSDPDGDSLVLTMESGTAAVATAQLWYLYDDDNGRFHAFCIHEEAAGAATFTVTATDPGGLSASLDFHVAVKPTFRIPSRHRWTCISTGGYGVSLGARCGSKICGNEGEGEMGLNRRDRYCTVSEYTCLTHSGSLSFDYTYSSEGAVRHVQVCPRRGGKEHGLFTRRWGAGADNGIGIDDPPVHCGVTPTAPASEVIAGFKLPAAYDPDAWAGPRLELLDMLQLPAATTVSFSCDGFPNTVPVVSRRIPIQYLTVGNSVAIDLDGVFEAAEWIPLAIYPEVRDPMVASVELVGTTLRIHPHTDGETEVLLNAVNEYGSTVNDFSISVGEFVDIFWQQSDGVFHFTSIPESSVCGNISCGSVRGYDRRVEPSSNGRCPLREQLKPGFGSVRFRYESSESGETGKRLFEVCPHPTAYPKNLPGWYTYLIDARGGWALCNDYGTSDVHEHAQLRFLLEGNGFRLVNGTITEIPSLETRLTVGIRFYGPLGYANSMMEDGLSVSAQLGVDDFVVAEHVCRDE